MNVVLCEYAGRRDFTAGNKARTDTVQIARNYGYKHIPLYRSKDYKVVVLFQMFFGCLRGIITANNGENILIQYPYYPALVNRAIIRILQIGKKLKHYKIILLIHDVVGLRSESINYGILQKEIQIFNSMDKVICHNEIMQSILIKNGGKENYSLLGPFDYLYDKEPINVEFQGEITIVIAGNLSKAKCGYVYDLSAVEGCSFNLYGVGYSGENNASISYKGQYPPDELIEHLDGCFGLVWDGDSIETCNGESGQYLKYNCPHKFSLYLIAGIPIIVWKQSALASYVNKLGLGICVESLYELSSLKVSRDSYMKMRENVLEYRKEIVAGEHLKAAISQDCQHHKEYYII